MDPQRQLEHETGVRIGQIDVEDLLDLPQAVAERVDVDVQPLGGGGDMTVAGMKDAEGVDVVGAGPGVGRQEGARTPIMMLTSSPASLEVTSRAQIPSSPRVTISFGSGRTRAIASAISAPGPPGGSR